MTLATSAVVRLTPWANSLRSPDEHLYPGKTLIPHAVTWADMPMECIGVASFLYSFPPDRPATLSELIARSPKDNPAEIVAIVEDLVKRGYVEQPA